MHASRLVFPCLVFELKPVELTAVPLTRISVIYGCTGSLLCSLQDSLLCSLQGSIHYDNFFKITLTYGTLMETPHVSKHGIQSSTLVRALPAHACSPVVARRIAPPANFVPRYVQRTCTGNHNPLNP